MSNPPHDTLRMVRLREELERRGLDCLALVPGPNLFYLTGLSFHLSERPVVALLPVDAPPAIVLPALEVPKLALAVGAITSYPYTDEEGPVRAFQQACAALELAEARIGVEGLRMRVMEARLLERYAPNCQLIPADEVMEELRILKDAGEIAALRRAVAVAEAALRAVLAQVRPGMTEREAAALLMVELLRGGGEGLPFEPIVVAGPNAASPHAVPTDRPIRTGEPVIIDCGAMVGGYVSDITRTVALGGLPEEMVRVYEVVRQANEVGRAHIQPGRTAQEVDRAARQVIRAAGYGDFFIHRTGHGLGLEVHEPPYIVEGNRLSLQTGMTFTVEPGVYLPGQGGVRIEDDVLVTPGGAETLTTFPRELLVL
ncbi:MAG: Xaa-Pro peptidase family protein [Anaerolineae bacterium]|nr:Xaa-Pro peptidase family protein [Anaerolineae bacterium]MDW8067375.1 Xaa-Pro peptidase family protein [Anaerolineae bacterium]